MVNILIGTGGPTDRKSIPLATRRGRIIPNEKRQERNPMALRAAVDLWGRERPATRLRSATGVYNCMGLIFASRRTWVDTEHLNTIFTDDEYRRVAGPPEIQPGDIVVYRDKRDGSHSHVAVIIKIEPEIETASWEITVMSQWGADGEYIHLIGNVPELLGEPVEYWTDRRSKP